VDKSQLEAIVPFKHVEIKARLAQSTQLNWDVVCACGQAQLFQVWRLTVEH
jgi:hypothetical protein